MSDKEDFQLQKAIDLLNVTYVLDILSKESLQWLSGTEDSQKLVETFEEFRAIRKNAKALRKRMRDAAQAVLGQYMKRRQAWLRKKIRRLLKEMQENSE